MSTPSTSIQKTQELVAHQLIWIRELQQQMAQTVIGQKNIIDRLIVAMICNGHVLLEGVPGLAKTLMLKTLAQAVHGRFQRVQFTPDMLPADIVGTLIYQPQKGVFETKHGPIFANFVLADEINRAPAKVQSALLEGMQERQVTLGEQTFALPDPFLVLATQNPLEQEGTYPLPEAQMDRFLVKLIVHYPNRQEERSILDARALTQPKESVTATVNLEQVAQARQLVNEIYIDDKLKDYIVDLILATREPERYGLKLGQFIRYGGSPRATISLTLASKAWAFLQGRAYVTPQDIKTLALDVLRHRVLISYEAEAENMTSEQVIQKILDTLPVP